MRILIVTHYVPHFPGAGAPSREFCLAQELAQRHEITYLLPLHQAQEGPQVDSLAAFCQVRFTPLVQTDRPSLAGRIQRRVSQAARKRLPAKGVIRQVFSGSRLLSGWAPTVHMLRQALSRIDWSEFDLVQVEHSTLGAALSGVRPPLPRLLSWHNIHSQIQERAYQSAAWGKPRLLEGLEWRQLQAYERRIAREFERSIVMSALDEQRLKRLEPAARVSVVPNGVNCGYFANPTPERCEDGTLVFTGLMDYEPNVEGVHFFCEQVLPLLLSQAPGVVFYIVGARPLPEVTRLAEQNPGRVVVTGTVADVRPYLQRAAVSVVPLLNGGGTRLKILEALSMQRAVVSSSVGCEGLSVAHGKDVLIADEPAAFAQAVLHLLTDPQERSRIAANGYRLAHEQYDWKFIARDLEAAWQAAHSEQRI